MKYHHVTPFKSKAHWAGKCKVDKLCQTPNKIYFLSSQVVLSRAGLSTAAVSLLIRLDSQQVEGRENHFN